MKSRMLITLYKLAEITLEPSASHTTIEIAHRLGLSQQTASRQLIELENQDMIQRERMKQGTTIKITEKGLRELHKMHLTLHRAVEAQKKTLILDGVVFTGLGEGAYYVGQPKFLSKFQEKLGFKPFIGTLNVRLKKEHLKIRNLLESISSVEIEGFRDGTRSYGPAKCYPATINGEAEACVVTPMRTHYGEDVIEILAPVNLRKKLRLKDGDTVRISLVG